MLLYSKLYDLLTGRSTRDGRPGLMCTVKELYGRNDKLRYVQFNTENDVPCLLYIPSKHEIKMDTKKFLSLSRWTDNDVNFEAVLAADPEVSIVNEVKSTSSPHGLINLIKRIEPSLKSIPYKIGIISEEYLLVLDEDNEVDVFYATGPKETKLLVVLDLEMLISKNILELERVHKNVCKLIQDSNDKYWDSLLELLNKCHQLKVVTKGKQKAGMEGLVDQSVKIGMSHKAIKLALECYD